MLNLWQNLPNYIDPVIFKIGSFPISWYWLMYLVGLGFSYWLLRYRIKHDSPPYSQEKFFWALYWIFIGILIGGRLGYIVFYNLEEFLGNPLMAINPFVSDEFGWSFRGIYGMSYHGGLLGAVLALLIYTGKNKLKFWKTLDFIIPVIPLGYFWGRIGNFLNGELYGRITEKAVGMHFPGPQSLGWESYFLRHPSQLYEAFFEGIILFIILWTLRNKIKTPGILSALYLLGYGIFRFFIEFFRQPDEHLGLVVTGLSMGQLFCLGMILIGIFIAINQKLKVKH